jgi:hypothetical protein
MDSPAELAQRVPTHLMTTPQSTNESKHLVRRVPTNSELDSRSQALPKVVEH